jgi:MoaA/NifB/PqqE/SkfB family radical SAM enzyme
MLSALSYAHRYNYSRFWSHKPILLAHSLTSACNCKCQICEVWRSRIASDEMRTDEVLKMLEEARKQNFVAYLAWGGEPLMRADIAGILGHAHKLGLYTSLITNGTFLSERAKDLSKVVDLTWVSLDHFSDYHDEMRGFEGAFDRAIDGINQLKNAGGRVAVNCVLSKLNLNSVRGMCELARSLGVKLAFDPMEIFPGFNDEYALRRSECNHLFAEVFELKKAGFPILNSYDYLAHLASDRSYSCAQPRVFMKVSETGEVAPFWCKRSNSVLGNVRKQSLGSILHSPSFNEFVKTTEGCRLCSNSSTVEVSMFYAMRRFFTNCLKMPNPILRFIIDFGL